jgi:hypothetical protein
LNDYTSFSFAFDGVVVDDFDGSANTKKDNIQKLITELLNKGKQVFIFTKRYSKQEVEYPNKRLKKILTEDNLNEYLKVKETCENLKISTSEVIWTSRGTYYQYLGDSYSHCHFDSSEYEIVLMNNFIPKVKTVNINTDKWESNDQ